MNRLTNAAIGLALVATPTMATADTFTFAAIPDGATATTAQPIVLTDAVDPSLTATIQPLGNAPLTKMAPDAAFPNGTHGYVTESAAFPAGIEIRFNRPVACAPGWGGGGILPLGTVVQWIAFHNDDFVAEGVIALELTDNGGFAIGSFSIPVGTIDRLEVRGLGPNEQGWGPVPIMMGDFFAIAETTCPADRTGDGIVNITDLLNYLQHWMQGGIGAEQNGDNPALITVSDLLVYLDRWFEGAATCR